MRRLMFMMIAGVVLFIGTSLPAQGSDYLTSIVNGLKHAPVYIAPGTEGTNATSASYLQGVLQSDDNIILVMLPNAAQSSVGNDAKQFVERLSTQLGAKYIIGFTMGSQAIGYAPSLPSGVAVNQMTLAQSVAQNNVDILTTFAQDVHQWQQEHPQPKKQAPTTSQSSGAQALVELIVPIVIVCFVAWFFVIKRKEDEAQESSAAPRIQFEGPGSIPSLLTEILRLGRRVDDPVLRSTIVLCCQDVQHYFQRFTNDRENDSVKFETHLKNIIEVLKKYLDVQDESRYYDNPVGLMAQAKETIEAFARFVLEACREGSSLQLLPYRVATDILNRRRNP